MVSQRPNTTQGNWWQALSLRGESRALKNAIAPKNTLYRDNLS